MRPLFFCLARPMNEEWKMRPYLGVLPLVFSALRARAALPGRGRGDRQAWLCMRGVAGRTSALGLRASPPATAPERKHSETSLRACAGRER